jgi:hypothetical protein
MSEVYPSHTGSSLCNSKANVGLLTVSTSQFYIVIRRMSENSLTCEDVTCKLTRQVSDNENFSQILSQDNPQGQIWLIRSFTGTHGSSQPLALPETGSAAARDCIIRVQLIAASTCAHWQKALGPAE